MEALESMIKTGGLAVPNTVIEKVKVRGAKGVYIEPEVQIAPVDQTSTFSIKNRFISELISDSLLDRAPTFEISMTVSSGTYVRSIVHDIGIALGSSAYVVKLTRTRQGEFTLNEPVGSAATSETAPSTSAESTATPTILPEIEEIFSGGCIEWSTLEAAMKEQEEVKAGKAVAVPLARGEYAEWEKELLAKCKMI